MKSGETVASCAGDEAGEVNNKHGIALKTAAIVSAMRKAKELDEKHKIAANAKKFAKGVVEKTREIDEKHRVVKKSKDAINRASVVARDIDEKHQLTSKTKVAAVNAMAKAKDVNEKHQVAEKTMTVAKLTMKQVALGVGSISKAIVSDKKDVGACKK